MSSTCVLLGKKCKSDTIVVDSETKAKTSVVASRQIKTDILGRCQGSRPQPSTNNDNAAIFFIFRGERRRMSIASGRRCSFNNNARIRVQEMMVVVVIVTVTGMVRGQQRVLKMMLLLMLLLLLLLMKMRMQMMRMMKRW